MNNQTKGRHLIVTGYVSDHAAERLWDAPFLATMIEEVIREVGMTVLVPPQMVTVPAAPAKADGPEDDGGVTGVAILSTSHVSIHTWPLHGRVSFDLYSCHDFDAWTVLAFLEERLGLVEADIVNLDRTPPSRGCGFRKIPV